MHAILVSVCLVFTTANPKIVPAQPEKNDVASVLGRNDFWDKAGAKDGRKWSEADRKELEQIQSTSKNAVLRLRANKVLTDLAGQADLGPPTRRSSRRRFAIWRTTAAATGADAMPDAGLHALHGVAARRRRAIVPDRTCRITRIQRRLESDLERRHADDRIDASVGRGAGAVSRAISPRVCHAHGFAWACVGPSLRREHRT